MSRVVITVEDDCCCRDRGHRQHKKLRIVNHYGIARKHHQPPSGVMAAPTFSHRKVATVIMDLAADKELPIDAPQFTDEEGNDVPAPDGFTIDYTSDNEAVLAIVTADDGTLVARSVSLGTANVSATASWTDSDGNAHNATGGPDSVNVVPGAAERVAINFGAAREITPDTPAPAPAPTA